MIKNLTRHVTRVKYLFTLEQDFEMKHELFNDRYFKADYLKVLNGTLFIPVAIHL